MTSHDRIYDIDSNAILETELPFRIHTTFYILTISRKPIQQCNRQHARIISNRSSRKIESHEIYDRMSMHDEVCININNMIWKVKYIYLRGRVGTFIQYICIRLYNAL